MLGLFFCSFPSSQLLWFALVCFRFGLLPLMRKDRDNNHLFQSSVMLRSSEHLKGLTAASEESVFMAMDRAVSDQAIESSAFIASTFRMEILKCHVERIVTSFHDRQVFPCHHYGRLSKVLLYCETIIETLRNLIGLLKRWN